MDGIEIMDSIDTIDTMVQNHTPLIVDLIIAIVFLLFIAIKGKRGLYSCGMSVFVIVISLTIGIFISSLVTPVIFKNVYPPMAEKLADRYDAEVEALQTGEETPGQMFSRGFHNLLKSLDLEDKAAPYTQAITDKLKQEVLEQRANNLYKLIRFAAFGFFTAMGALVLTIIKNYFGAISDWPVIKWLDGIGGMVIGFLEAYALFFLIIKGADFLGIQFFNQMSEGTVLLDFINSHKDAKELYEMGISLVQGGAEKFKNIDLPSFTEGIKDAVSK